MGGRGIVGEWYFDVIGTGEAREICIESYVYCVKIRHSSTYGVTKCANPYIHPTHTTYYTYINCRMAYVACRVHVLCVCNADTDGFVQLLLPMPSLTNIFRIICALCSVLCVYAVNGRRGIERERGGWYLLEALCMLVWRQKAISIRNSTISLRRGE